MTTSGHDENAAVEVVSSCLLFSSLRSILHFFQGCLLDPWCCLPIYLQWLPTVHNVKCPVWWPQYFYRGPTCQWDLISLSLLLNSMCSQPQFSCKPAQPYKATLTLLLLLPKVASLAHGAAQWTKRLGLTQVQGESQTHVILDKVLKQSVLQCPHKKWSSRQLLCSTRKIKGNIHNEVQWNLSKIAPTECYSSSLWTEWTHFFSQWILSEH